MTPLILVILAAMWAAVLLPPYLRDKGETKAAGNRNDSRSRLDALTSSFSSGRSYLPVRGSGQTAGQVPLPHGARQPVATGQERMPQSSAVQILGHDGTPEEAPAQAPVTEIRPMTSAAVESHTHGTPASTDAPSSEGRSGSSVARQRRKDVLHLLLGVCGLSLVATIGLGGPMLYLHVLADLALIGYVYLLVQHRKTTAEREMKVAFLPHGGTGASATALLEEGGGWNPGGSIANVRVLRAEAN